jgi:hypothetical protein
MEPLRTVQYSGSIGRSGGGLMGIVMLVIGVSVGAGTSFYFADSRKKAEAQFEEQRQKLLSEQRELADSMALLHANFSDLVTGKSLPIPQLKAEMTRVQRAMNERIAAVNDEAAGQRARASRRLTGDALDRALEDIDRDRKRRVKRVEDEYLPSLRVYEKRLLLYQDLLGTKS